VLFLGDPEGEKNTLAVFCSDVQLQVASICKCGEFQVFAGEAASHVFALPDLARWASDLAV
jgi:hypothetical protein